MDPGQLCRVLRLNDLPTLQVTSIVGWKMMLWGEYPALIFKPGNVVYGMTCEIQKELHFELLKNYETEAYKIKGCRIKLADGMEVLGETFIYDGERDLLKEGSFDLKDWQMEQLEKKL
jgi:hypothetical protein